VSDILAKLREKLDMSVPSLGKYTLRVGENVVDKSRLPKVIDADFSQREDQDKEQVVIQKKTRAKPVLHVVSDDPHVMRRVRAKVKGKDLWKCTRCRVSTRKAKMCGKLLLRQCVVALTDFERMPRNAPSAISCHGLHYRQLHRGTVRTFNAAENVLGEPVT